MGRILIVAPAEMGVLHPGTREIATLALSLSVTTQFPIVATVAGGADESCLGELSRLGAQEIVETENTSDFPPTADRIAAQLVAVAKECDAKIILAPHTLETAEWLPLLAAQLDAAVITDCKSVEFDGRVIATKLICGGAIGAEYAVERNIAVLSVTAGVYAPQTQSAEVAPIRRLPVVLPHSCVSVVDDVVANEAVGPALKQAKVVVSGGLGIGKGENWSLVTDLAQTLDAAVGASRAAVESGWAPYNQQVGYSGVKVAPQLYIAIGISGALHHLAGISLAKAIVAINIDPKAEIFKVAQFGIVGDASQVVPALTQRLREIRQSTKGN